MFVIHNIAASRVNLIMNDFVAGMPTPLSFIGLTDAIGRSLGLRPWSGRCLPIMHEVHPSKGRTKAEMDNDAGVFSPVEMVEDMHGLVRLSLVIDIPGLENEIALKDALIGKRIAGGAIDDRGIKVASVTPDGSVFRKIARGYAMVPPADSDLRKHFGGSSSDLNAFADLAFPRRTQVRPGIMMPSAVGYRLLEDPLTVPRRENTRDANVPHVFAEPIIGLVELISARSSRLSDLDAAGLSKLLWSWTGIENFIVGNDAYLTPNS